MTKDVAYQRYKEALAKINKQACEAREDARATFREQLRVLRNASHEELKAIRVLEQQTKNERGYLVGRRWK